MTTVPVVGPPPVPLLLVLLSLLGCAEAGRPGAEVAAGSESACVEGFQPGNDYFPDKAETRWAEHFSVSYHGHYKVIQTSVPFGSVDVRLDSTSWEMAASDVMVLVRCGTPPPPLEGPLAGASVVSTPVSSVAVNDDVLGVAVRMVGELEALVGVGGEGIFDTLVDGRRRSGAARAIGYSFHGPPYLEVLLELQPGVTLLQASTGETAGSIDRLRDLGLPAAPAFYWAETHPLAVAEWLKYVALFLDAEEEANRTFSRIEDRYRTLAAQARAQEPKPSVIWAQGGRSEWTAHVRGVGARLLEDAGAVNLLGAEGDFAAVGGRGPYEGEPFSLERLLEAGGDADWWITYNPTDQGWPSADYLNEIRAYRDRRVYHHNKRRREADDAYDWFESARLRPDLLLEDLTALFHPDVLSEHSLYYLAPISLTDDQGPD